MTENTTGYGNARAVVEALDRLTRATLTHALVDAVASGRGELVTLVVDALRGDERGVETAIKAVDGQWLRFD